jgi:ribonuclease R
LAHRPAPLPTREQLLEFIRQQPGKIGKREIARAFSVTAANRPLLRQMLKELETAGDVHRGHGRRVGAPGALPDMIEIAISGTDNDGELLARPVAWTEPGRPPRIYMATPKQGEQPLGLGDRALVRLKRLRDGSYEARIVRRVTEGPARVLGIIEESKDGYRLRPVDRRQKADFLVAKSDIGGAQAGELVLAEPLSGRPHGLKPARVVERLGGSTDPRSISLMSIVAHDIPNVFPHDVVAEAEAAQAAPLDARTDLRKIPLITIDGEDARDFDDAVWAEAGPGDGWTIMVAIADVAWYVRPGSPLDKEAWKRGNSVYFPDRVVPMLPEALSNGWCSLRPDEDHPCLAVRIVLDAEGNKISHHFMRGLMRSAARLTYTKAQAAIDGNPDESTRPLLDPVLKPLYGAWKALLAERQRRGTLELDLPERQVFIGADGTIEKILPRPRYDSHRLIEDFMIAANVAAAEQIEAVRRPCMYRVHDQPAQDKLIGLRDFLKSLGFDLAKGQVLKPMHFNKLLERAKDSPEARLVNEMVLRSQAQAVYSPNNIGHFGLGLARYAHFTSPIRRYSDLLVHRALIDGLKLGDGGLPAESEETFAETGEHISLTERRAAAAERDALDRFTARFLADRVGAAFSARVNGVTRFGLFLTLDETGASGLLPMSALPDDYYIHDETRHTLTGRRHGATYRLGDTIEVALAEANPMTGGMLFRPTGVESRRSRPSGQSAPAGKPNRPVGPGKPRRPRR